MMNRLNSEIEKRVYTMEIDEEIRPLTPEEERDWDDMWMLNKIVCAVRFQRNVE